MTEQAIFLAALDHDASAQRTAYLDQACGADAALRLRVEALLRSHLGAESFLAVPALAQVAAGNATEAIEPSAVRETAGDAPALAFLAPSQHAGSLGRLDHYQVQEVVGQGGMGVVLKAFDEKLHRVVAIKALAPALATNGTARKRFVREAQAAAAVSHDHIVAIHAVGDAGPVPYLVMHYVAGISLEDRIKQGGPLELKEILRIGLQTAHGLAAAHAQGLVHRDVKPANILLENGVQRVKITDFGLARAVDDASLTQSGVIAGTPMYMSPEQARGEAVDHRSDLFSLGSVLYALCTGRPPFRASNTMAVLKRVCEETPRPITAINADIPAWLAAIIARLHAKDPAERFQSASEVAELLSQHLAHLQQPQVVALPAPLSSASPRREQGARRFPPGTRRGLVLMAGLLVAGWAFNTYVLHRPGDEPVGPIEAARVQGSDAAFDRLRRADIAPALLALAGGGDPDQAPPELVAMLGNVDPFKLPAHTNGGWMAISPDSKTLAVTLDNVIILFDAQTGAMLRTLTGHTSVIFSVAFNHDGKRIASASDDRSVRVWDAVTGEQVHLLDGHTNGLFRVAYSPDGELIASASNDRTIRVWDARTGKPLQTITGQNVAFHSVCFTPNSKRIVSCNFANLLEVWDAHEGTKVLDRAGHTSLVQTTAFSRNGKLLATGSDKELILWDADTFDKIHTEPTPAGNLAFTPDDGTLLLACHDPGQNTTQQVATRWDVPTRKEQSKVPLKGMNARLLFCQLSRDGKVLFARGWRPPGGNGSNDPLVRAYDAATGTELFQNRQPIGAVYSVAVSSDGRTLASGGADHKVRLWDLAGWQAGDALPPVRALTAAREQKGAIRSVVFSPDDKLLASGSEDGSIALWDVASGAMVRSLAGRLGSYARVTFSPDGRTIAAGGKDGTIRLWDVAGGKLQKEIVRAHEGVVREVAFSPDDKLLASAGVDGFLRVWEMPSGEPVDESAPLGAAVTSVAFSPDGQMLGAGCDAPDTKVRLWDISNQSRLTLKAELPGHTSHISKLAFQPGGGLACSSGCDGTVRLWDGASSGKKMLTIGGAFGAVVQGVTFSPKGGYLVTANDNGTIAILKTPAPPPPYDPGPPIKLPDPLELAKRPSAADSLKREDIPADLLARAGGGDPKKAPAELVAMFGGQDGHTNQVLSVAISPDGKVLASVSVDRTVKLWNLATGQLSCTLTGHTDIVRSVAFSPDGKILASAGEDRTIKLWEVASGKERRTLTGHTSTVNCVTFSPDGQRLVSAANDSTVRLWDPNTGRPVRTLQGHQGGVYGVTYSPDGKILATAGTDRVVRLWDPATGWELGALQGHTDLVRHVAFDPDGRMLGSCSHDKMVRLWDLTHWPTDVMVPVRALEGHKQMIIPFAWRADGKLLASGSCDGTLRLWDTAQAPARSKVLRLFPPGDISITGEHGIAFTPEGRYVATANLDHTVYILKLAEPGEVFQVPPPHVELQPKAAWRAHDRFITSVLFADDGNTLISASKDGFVKFWNWRAEPGKGPEQSLAAQEDGVRALARSTAGKYLATAAFDGGIRLWDAKGNPMHELPGHKGGTAALSFVADGTQLVSGGADGKVRFWNVNDGKQTRQLDVAPDGITYMSITRDGKVLATCSNDMVRVQDLAANDAFSVPDRVGGWLSPDGARLAVATRSGIIELRDATRGKSSMRLRGHAEPPEALCFTADGKRLLSCGKDGTLCVWDASSGHVLAVLRGCKGPVCCVALAADGKTAAAGGENGQLLRWDLSALTNP